MTPMVGRVPVWAGGGGPSGAVASGLELRVVGVAGREAACASLSDAEAVWGRMLGARRLECRVPGVAGWSVVRRSEDGFEDSELLGRLRVLEVSLRRAGAAKGV